MTLPQSLPISNLIKVSVSLAQQAAQGQNLNALLIIGSSNVIDVVTRIRLYTSIDQVALDFGTSAPEYLAAVLWFEQNPQPTSLYIGRWAQTATAGVLFGGLLSATQQLIASWNAITNGGFHITVDGGSSTNITGLDFSASMNMNGVAAVIDTALSSHGADCAWDAINNRFFITSHSTGAASVISFLTSPVSGTDISGLLEMTAAAATDGAFQANGIAAESALQAVVIFDNQYGQQWFGLTVLGTVDADSEVIAPYIEAADNKHFFGITTQEAGVITPGNTSNIAYILMQAGYDRTAVQYSSTNAYAVVSMLGRILTTDYAGNNTVITLMYKVEPGIVPENLNSSQAAAAKSCNCNVFAAYNNNTAIIQFGTSASGQFIDSVIGAMALGIDIQTALYNVLYLSTTKVPQTDAGTHLLTTAIAAVCTQYVANGLLAPGTWTSNGFGQLKTGDSIPGYYIFAPTVALQPAADRSARISVPIQVAAKLAGAVHTVDVAIIVNN